MSMKLIKNDVKKAQNILYIAIQIAAALSILSEPFLPFSSKKLKTLLGISNTKLKWNDIISLKEIIKPNHLIEKPELLFKKIEDDEIDYQINKLNKKTSGNSDKKKKNNFL